LPSLNNNQFVEYALSVGLRQTAQHFGVGDEIVSNFEVANEITRNFFFLHGWLLETFELMSVISQKVYIAPRKSLFADKVEQNDRLPHLRRNEACCYLLETLTRG
jgi:hypothetical protein